MYESDRGKNREPKGLSYNTDYSQVVSHPSTRSANTRLTSEIGRDPVKLVCMVVAATFDGKWTDMGFLSNIYITMLLYWWKCLLFVLFCIPNTIAADINSKLNKWKIEMYRIVYIVSR